MKFLLLLLALLALAPAADARLGAEGLGGVTQQVAITGITCATCTTNTAAAVGATVGSLTATVTGGPSLRGPVFALVADGGSGMIVSGNTLQVGPGGPPAAATYSVQISVTGSNASNAPPPQTYTVSAVVSSSLTITGISASGCTVNAGAAQGTAICTMTPTYSGGSPGSQTVTCANCISSEFQVGGTNPFILQVGSAGVTAGSPTPTFTVTAASATNSPQTYGVPVTVNAAPILITGITTSPSPAAGTVGDAQGTNLATLTATGSGGSLGTVSYSITCGTCNNNGSRFQITGSALQAGATPYSAGSYSNAIQVTSSTASNSPFVVSGVQAQIASSGSPSIVQKRAVTNFGGSTTPAGFWLDVGQPFAQGQVPSGDGVLWKTGGGTTITSQADDCSYWSDGSVRFCSFTLLFPTALTSLQQDNAVGAYDNPGAAPGHTCFSGTPTSLITSHDFRVEATLSAAQVTGSFSGTTLTVASVQRGALAIGQTLWGVHVSTPQTITGGSGSTWTVTPGGTFSNGPISAGTGTTYTMSANNEFANEASTHTIMYRSGPEVCSYVISGQLRNGTTFGSAAQGQIWGQLYVDARVDGTYRVEGRVYHCQPLINSTTQITACNWIGLAPDANGDMFAIKDYSLGGDPILMGCAYAPVPSAGTPACVSGGHATSGQGTAFFYGSVFPTLTFDGWAYDTQTDVHKVLPGFLSLTSSDLTTRGWYDAYLAPNLGYTPTMLSDIATSSYTEGGYGPNVCANYSTVGCAFGTTGESGFIGLISQDMSQCLLASAIVTSSAGWRVCNNSRIEALTMGAVQMTWRDQLTGRQVNLSSFFTPPAGTMNTFTTGGWGGLPSSGQITADASGYGNHQAQPNHEPNFAEMQCILTGQRPFCDMVRDQANADIGIQNKAFRNTTINGHSYSAITAQVAQVRLMAWMERDISNAFWLTPDFLVDGVTTNPEKSYFDALLRGVNGTLTYFNDLATAPYMTTAQQTLGIIAPLGPNGAGPIEAIYWQAGYWANVGYLEALRGNFNSTNCRNGSFTTAFASCNIFTNYLHKFYLGAAVNGCMAYAAPAYALSSTIASRPYALDNTGIVAQAWSDIYTGDVESNSQQTGGQASQPPGQVAGSTIELTFSSTPTTPPAVGVNLNFGVKTSLTQSGITIPAEVVVTSVTRDTSGTCATGTCYILGLSAPMTGGTIPTNIPAAFYTITWGASPPTSGGYPPQIPWPLIPAAGCPSQGLSSNPLIMNGGSLSAHVQYLYAAAVLADQAGDSYGTTIRQYFENFNGSPNPGGVKPGFGRAGYSPQCAGSFANWDINNGWPNDAANAGFSQWVVWPVGAPTTDSAGHATGCN